MRARFSAILPGASSEPMPPLRLAYTPSDTPPSRVKKPWRMPGSALSDVDCSMTISARRRSCRRRFEAGQKPELWIGNGDYLEQSSHVGATFTHQALDRAIDLLGFGGRHKRRQRGCALVNAERAQELRLLDRTLHARPHALRGLGKGLEIHMSREIDLPRALQRILES